MAPTRVLLVEDEPTARRVVRDYLAARGFEVVEAASCGQGRALHGESRCDAAVVDYMLPDGNALELLAGLRQADPGLPVVVMTGHATIDLAVRAIQQGADHFMTKPVALASLVAVVERLVAARRDRRVRRAAEVEARRAIDPFVGASAAIRLLAADAERVLTSDSLVLVLGETGSGKGTLAQWLHAKGPRRDEPFVDLNCAGLTRELLESELFGHERGAFTGAVTTKSGLFEVADRGTLFLDEVGDLDLEVQAKLLKAIETKRFRRLGDVAERQVDVRLIAATHVNLAARVRDQRFRSDLYFRVSALPLVVPPLRERVEDIPVLASQMLATLASELGRPGLELTPAALRRLAGHAWPGNIRELRNVLERAVLYSSGRLVDAPVVRFDAAASPRDRTGELSLTLADVERRHLTRMVEAERGNVERAAARLGISRSTLYQKMRELGLPSLSERSRARRGGRGTKA
ncbi:MAG: sigma-54-dependent Fis family transcriptional regulator [Deltaproteobacteria bacterium]|nr:sigma-54-dependent Fis family transcriptional regulator [Deltaproteobacteria bacterium]